MGVYPDRGKVYTWGFIQIEGRFIHRGLSSEREGLYIQAYPYR